MVLKVEESGVKRLLSWALVGKTHKPKICQVWVSIRLEQKKWIGLWKRPLKDDGLGLEGLGDCEYYLITVF